MSKIVKTEVATAAGPKDERYQTDRKIAFRMENAPIWLAEQMFGDSAPPTLVLHDLDRVKLKQAVTFEGTSLRSGLEGTVVMCHGSSAYEVEFDGIDDFFAMEPGFLEKI